MAADVSQFVLKTISLLNLERKAEIEETRTLQETISPKELQKRGVCLLKLRIRARRTGLYGRSLLTFEINKAGTDGKLPSHSLTPGKYIYSRPHWCFLIIIFFSLGIGVFFLRKSFPWFQSHGVCKTLCYTNCIRTYLS